MTLEDVMQQLEALANPEKVLYKSKKFGINAPHSLGIYHKDLKQLAKTIGNNDALAISLFNTGLYEAKILCSKIFDYNALTEVRMDDWCATFETWEICDSFCMGLFSKSDFALDKAIAWSKSDQDFIKRASFCIMAAYGFSHKNAPNQVFLGFFPLIEKASEDDRIYVKKAVNWALRNIGKRNRDLNVAAIEVANKLLLKNNKTSNWIARNAIKELQSSTANILDYPRSIYR